MTDLQLEMIDTRMVVDKNGCPICTVSGSESMWPKIIHILNVGAAKWDGNVYKLGSELFVPSDHYYIPKPWKDCQGNLREVPVYATYNGKRYQMSFIIVCDACNQVVRGIDTGEVYHGSL